MIPPARLLAGFAVLLLAGLASAADRSWNHPYGELCEKLYLEKFYDTPEAERDQLRLLYKVDPAALHGQPLVLTINAPQPLRVVSDAKGILDIPFDRRLKAANPDILINLPEGEKISIALELRPVIPRERELDYARFMAAIPQANQIIRRQAGGVLSLFAPTIDKLVLRYDQAAGQVVEVGSGAETARYQVNAEGVISIPYRRELAEHHARVRLSHLPTDAGLED
jgi:hypothetical protein